MTERISFDAFDEVTALPRAKMGDMRGLAARVQSGETLSQAERDFVAGYLIGAIRPSKAALRREEKLDDYVAIATWVLQRQIVCGGSLEGAIQEATDAFGLARRTIQTALKHHAELPGHETRYAYLDTLRRHVDKQRK